MPQEFTALLAVVAALTVGVVSPGPSFVLVARVAVSASRSQAVAAALGMGVGGVLFGVAALLGLQGVLLAIPSLYVALKVLGGVYLCYLGIVVFRSAKQPLVASGTNEKAGAEGRSFWLGLSTQLSNPKTAIVYASVFAAFLPKSFSGIFAASLLALVFTVEFGWYAVVALVLSSPTPQKLYMSCKAWVDRFAGTVLSCLGLRLVADATRP